MSSNIGSRRSTKTRREKLAGCPRLPEVEPVSASMQRRHGKLSLKYPAGLDELMRRLESEGHTVAQRGAHYFVEDFETKALGS